VPWLRPHNDFTGTSAVLRKGEGPRESTHTWMALFMAGSDQAHLPGDTPATLNCYASTMLKGLQVA
jgi:hypothetical protein